ncbi:MULTISPECIES: hypothetical protein [unclassified Photobacterium]|nr:MULTISPECIES: hypothetical protein [unclassified Photobacterium]
MQLGAFNDCFTFSDGRRGQNALLKRKKEKAFKRLKIGNQSKIALV